MQTFKITNELQAVCGSQKTRNGFKHTAALIKNGQEITNTKISYLNRTWESYKYESVLQKLLEKSKPFLTPDEITAFKTAIAAGGRRGAAQNKSAAWAASLGDALYSDKMGGNLKARNDWKIKMINARFGKGLILPDDWDKLDEKIKQARLDNALEILK